MQHPSSSRLAAALAWLIGLIPIALHAPDARAAAAAQKPVLTLSVARTVLSAALAHAHEVNAPGAAIAIVDDGGSIVLLERLDETFPAGPDVSIGKARTAAAFHKPTRAFEELINKGRTAMVTVPEVTHFTPLQGGVPLVIDGRIVGGIGVSGAASAAQDDEIAQAGADGLRATDVAGTVGFFPASEVSGALRQGSRLVRNEAFSVEASRRDAPGQAEIHVRDTDVFYVIGGRARLVTGGTITDPAPIATGEIRGRSIEGGNSYELSAGTVVTIPRGIPHWFREVQSPLTYFVVKSTTTEE